jgi:hypothetical protein
MIEELREVGQVHGAPILVSHLEAAGKEWVGLAYKNALGKISLCFWSTRGDERMPTNDLCNEVASDVTAALDAGAEEQVRERLFDIGYKQPRGWDRWGRPGVPHPIRAHFDEVLHPRLKALLRA